MAKKIKNINHTHAIRRKRSASERVERIGLTLTDDKIIIGILFDHLGMSQLTYFGLNSINKICKEYAFIDICIFSQHITPPCISVSCPIFNISHLIRWYNYPLITTSLETTENAIGNSNTNIIYYYMFDPEFIYRSNRFRQLFNNSRIKIITRHLSHKQLVEEEFNILTHDTIVPDFNVEQLIKLISMEIKKCHQN